MLLLPLQTETLYLGQQQALHLPETSAAAAAAAGAVQLRRRVPAAALSHHPKPPSQHHQQEPPQQPQQDQPGAAEGKVRAASVAEQAALPHEKTGGKAQPATVTQQAAQPQQQHSRPGGASAGSAGGAGQSQEPGQHAAGQLLAPAEERSHQPECMDGTSDAHAAQQQPLVPRHSASTRQQDAGDAEGGIDASSGEAPAGVAGGPAPAGEQPARMAAGPQEGRPGAWQEERVP